MAMQRNSSPFIVLLILMLAPIGQIGIDIYVTALPAMASSFRVSSTQIQLSTSLYMLAFACGQILYGPLADAYGRKRILLLGVGMFFFASIATIISNDFSLFMAGRIMQGVSITVCSVLMKAIASDYFSGHDLAKVSNYMVIVWGIAPVVAPMIGAGLQICLGWQSCLYLLLGYSALLFLVIWLGFRETLRVAVPLRFGLLRRNAMMILGDRKFRSCYLGMGFCYSILLTFNLCSPFIIQQVMHYSPLDYGKISLLMGACFFAGVSINRFKSVRRRAEKVCLYSAWTCVASSLAMLALGQVLGLTIVSLTLPAAMITLFSGVIFPNLMAEGMSLFPDLAGLSSSLLGFMLMTFAALIMIFSSFINLESLTPVATVFFVVSIGALESVRRLNSTKARDRFPLKV
jgi:Bcr/CflA subfamily drug resistance transporter